MLREEGIETLQDLTQLVAQRGPGWWRAIPRIGPGRAAVIAAWLRQHAKQLGELPTLPAQNQRPHAVVQFDPAQPQLAPLGKFFLPPALDAHDGINRSLKFSFISARDDLSAVDCYLSKFHHQPHTHRAYRRELERFVLWASIVAQKPLSSLLVDDCEAYKRFLEGPAPAFRGKKAPRSSTLWKPFSTEAMQPASVKYAIQVLRAAFWMLEVLGKRSKWRKVPVSQRTIAALRAHWDDLGVSFDVPAELPLLSPVIIPPTEAAKAKHGSNDPRGYRSGSLFDLVRAALKRVLHDLDAVGADGVPPDLALEDIAQYKSTTPHAFRHTFGTQAVAHNMPVTVVQDVMGHADSATTATYVREKEKRVAAEAAKYFDAIGKKE